MSSNPKYRSLRGMPDILPEEAVLMHQIEDKARDVFKRFGYGEIRTPFLEKTEVFTRSIGEDTDIVEKEMYSFEDRGGKNISLRPEGTASIVRAYVENGLHNTNDLVKLYYVGPMFRGERPQKGRLRQFHQIGAEIIGGKDPYIDAELILSLNVFLSELGLEGFTILLNSLGCEKDRTRYKKELKKYLTEKNSKLCDDCQRRTKTNVLRALDCKNKECKKVVTGGPVITDSLCEECASCYEKLKSILKSMDIPFSLKTDMVRGLDYYTGTIFEVVHPDLGSQDAIAAGGRYDNLTKQMSGPDVGATGYAVGIERLLLILEDEEKSLRSQCVLVIPMDESIYEKAFEITTKLRIKGIPSDIDLSRRSFKAQMRKANREERENIIILGDEEIKTKKILVKNMATGEQETLSLDAAIEKLRKGKNDKNS